MDLKKLDTTQDRALRQACSCENGNEFAALIEGAVFLDQLNDYYSLSRRPVVNVNTQKSGTSSSLNMNSHFSISNTHRRTQEGFRPNTIIFRSRHILLYC
jgi:hypothetical protein